MGLIKVPRKWKSPNPAATRSFDGPGPFVHPKGIHFPISPLFIQVAFGVGRDGIGSEILTEIFSDGLIERFHRSMKRRKSGPTSTAAWGEAPQSIARFLHEYNHDRPHQGIGNRTPNEARLACQTITYSEALTV